MYFQYKESKSKCIRKFRIKLVVLMTLFRIEINIFSFFIETSFLSNYDFKTFINFTKFSLFFSKLSLNYHPSPTYNKNHYFFTIFHHNCDIFIEIMTFSCFLNQYLPTFTLKKIIEILGNVSIFFLKFSSQNRIFLQFL